jgi:transcription antitermination factor NusG
VPTNPSTIALLAVQTGSELTVREQTLAHGIKAYVPQYLVNMRHSGMTAKALFPGYVFIWVIDQWRMLLRLMHVYDFLRCGKEIAFVSPKIIKELKKREGPTGYIRIDNKFFIGQAVALRKQPNLAGVYLGLNNEYKARVLFSMLGRELEIAVFEQELLPA